jgi:hypothetical protein
MAVTDRKTGISLTHIHFTLKQRSNWVARNIMADTMKIKVDVSILKK